MTIEDAKLSNKNGVFGMNFQIAFPRKISDSGMRLIPRGQQVYTANSKEEAYRMNIQNHNEHHLQTLLICHLQM
jgi:hypothetical protein